MGALNSKLTDSQRNKGYVSVAEGAALVQRPAVTVRWWARHGKVRAKKSGETWLVRRDSLLEFAGLN